MNVAPRIDLGVKAEHRITRLRLWHVPLTSHTAYYMAEGKACDTVEPVVIAVETDRGVTGWGEVCPIPHYLPAYARGVAPALQELAPVILGGDPIGVEALMARADAHLPGHVYAKSALDIALWDITGQAAGLPLHALMGGKRQSDLPLYHSITCVEPDEMARIAREAQAKGSTQFQAKLGASGDWSTDVERLAKVREAVGHGPLVYGDWNCGSTSLDAIRVGRGAADLDVMLEQPCATLEDCARVQRATHLPMKLDELCSECTWGSDISMAAALHLGAGTAPQRLLNVCDLSGYVAPRLAPDGPTRDGGRIAAPEAPGLGITVDAEALGAPDLILD